MPLLSCKFISAALVVLLAAFLAALLAATRESLEFVARIPPPPDAVPIWRKSELTFVNRLVEYIFPLVAPIHSMARCPFEPPDPQCMSKARDTTKKVNDMGWRAMLQEGTYSETSFAVEQQTQTGHGPVEVVVLYPSNATDDELRSAPTIVFLHGGGFVLGAARDMYMLTILKGLEDQNTSPTRAVWVSVDYPLAPEFPYPAAPDACSAALRYLVHNYRLHNRVRLGGGGLHIAGTSAGASLAVATSAAALASGIDVGSVYLDNLIGPIGIDRPGGGALDVPSVRRNYYTRITPLGWVGWFERAYAGAELLDWGRTPSEGRWREMAPGGLPPVVVVTCSGDIFHDVALPFMDVYRRAGGVVHHIEAKASHALHLVVNREASETLFSTWGGIIESVHSKIIAVQ